MLHTQHSAGTQHIFSDSRFFLFFLGLASVPSLSMAGENELAIVVRNTDPKARLGMNPDFATY